MKNISTRIDGNILFIEVDLSKNCGRSKSGKTTIIATSEGCPSVEGKPEVKINLNVFK